MRIVQEEVSLSLKVATRQPECDSKIFGPVIAAASFTTESEAIGLANSSVFGLAAAVFSADHTQAMRTTAALDAGTVWCNQYLQAHNGVPFGGFKQSGVGRELGTYGMEEYMQVSSAV